MNRQMDRVINWFLIIAAVTVIILKIVGVIKIPWLWLLSPIWIVLGFGILFIIVIVIIFSIEKIKDKKENKNERY